MNIKRSIKYNVIRLLRLKSDPKEIALGLSLGFIPNWFPTFGFGPAISVAIGRLFKTNLISAFIGGISGTIIWPVLFYLNYKVGHLILDFGSTPTTINMRHINHLGAHIHTKKIGLDFLLGSFINVILFSLIIYFVTYMILIKYRFISLRKINKR